MKMHLTRIETTFTAAALSATWLPCGSMKVGCLSALPVNFGAVAPEYKGSSINRLGDRRNNHT